MRKQLHGRLISASTMVFPTDAHSTMHALQRTEVTPLSRVTSNIGLDIAHHYAAHGRHSDGGTGHGTDNKSNHPHAFFFSLRGHALAISSRYTTAGVVVYVLNV